MSMVTRSAKVRVTAGSISPCRKNPASLSPTRRAAGRSSRWLPAGREKERWHTISHSTRGACSLFEGRRSENRCCRWSHATRKRPPADNRQPSSRPSFQPSLLPLEPRRLAERPGKRHVLLRERLPNHRRAARREALRRLQPTRRTPSSNQRTKSAPAAGSNDPSVWQLRALTARRNEVIQLNAARSVFFRWFLTLGVGPLSACQPASTPRTGYVPVTSAHAAPGGVRRTLLERQPAANLPGWETRLYLVEYAPGVSAPVHVHPAIGVGYVIAGRFESAFGDAPAVEVSAGQGFLERADLPHRIFRNPSRAEPLRFIVAFTLRSTDDPFYLTGGAAVAAPN